MTRAELLERVQELGGFGGSETKAIEATIEALGVALTPDERRAVSEHLPVVLRPILETSARLPDLDLEGFFERVGSREGIGLGRAREHAQVVCRALVEILPSEATIALQKHLPRLALLFELPKPTSPPDAPERMDHPSMPGPPSDHTLACGRPGSRHPLSEARPERAHTHSVARSDNPHGDTKLSSAHGLTQERERETLATGRAGTKNPLTG